MNSLSIELADVTFPMAENTAFNGKVTILDADGNKIAEGYATQIQFSVGSGGGFTSYYGVPDSPESPNEALAVWEPLEVEYEYDGDSVLGLLRTLIPGINAMTARCPVDDCDSHVAMADRPLPDLVIHLNDAHGMSREQIAEWLDTLPYDLTLGQEPKVTIESLVPKAHAPAGSATATVLDDTPSVKTFSGKEVCYTPYDYAKVLLCSCGWSTSPKTTGELARFKALNDHIKEGNQG